MDYHIRTTIGDVPVTIVDQDRKWAINYLRRLHAEMERTGAREIESALGLAAIAYLQSQAGEFRGMPRGRVSRGQRVRTRGRAIGEQAVPAELAEAIRVFSGGRGRVVSV